MDIQKGALWGGRFQTTTGLLLLPALLIIVLLVDFSGTGEMQAKSVVKDDRIPTSDRTSDPAKLSNHTVPLPSARQGQPQPVEQQTPERVRPVDENQRTIFDTTMLRNRARTLRQEATDIRGAKNITRNSTKIHIFSYATAEWNLTMERLQLEAERSGFYESVWPFNRQDLDRIDPEFVGEFGEILNLPRGGGYWLWKFPLLEHMLRTMPLNDYIFYLDSGSSVLSSAKSELDEWMRMLSDSGQEILRFRYFIGRRAENHWCVSRMFSAFNLTCADGSNTSWWGCASQPQLPATGFVAMNGAAIRETLALIYDALSQDPWIITDVYNEESKIGDNRHDQCLLSIASKQMANYVTLPTPNVDFSLNKCRVVQFSRISGPRPGQPEKEIDPTTFAYWKRECLPRDAAKDLFCDHLAIRLSRGALADGGIEELLTFWNKSMSDLYNFSTVAIGY